MIDLHKGIPERKFRNELKYVCSQGELEMIRSRIRVLCPPDPHAGATGIYNIRSIYFDDLDNRCYYENENGTDPRQKFRIRIYNASDRRISLECKRKEHTMTNKESCRLSREQFDKILAGQQPELDSPLLRRFWALQAENGLAPKVIVAYERTPFVYAPGNVRITFDRNIGSTTELDGFFRENLPPAAGDAHGQACAGSEIRRISAGFSVRCDESGQSAAKRLFQILSLPEVYEIGRKL